MVFIGPLEKMCIRDSPQTAHEIGLKLAQKLWGNGYQVIVATHLDQESHIHNHFVVNTVSFKDGKRYHRTEKDYYDMQKESDRLCREYGLSVIENPQRGKSKHYGEWKAEQDVYKRQVLQHASVYRRTDYYSKG